MIAGGVPKYKPDHAINIVEMAFSMLNAMKTLKDPCDKTGKDHLKLRVGMWQSCVLRMESIYPLARVEADST